MYSSLCEPLEQDWYQSLYLDPFVLPRLPPLHEFSDPTIEDIAFTMNAHLAIPSDVNLRRISQLNERSKYLGESVLRFLISEISFRLLPEASGEDLVHLSSAFQHERFLAMLSRQYGFNTRMDMATTTRLEDPHSDRALAGVFQAYIGSVYKDMGLSSVTGLLNWFEAIMEPYIHPYYQRMKTWRERGGSKEPTFDYDGTPLSRIPTFESTSTRRPSRISLGVDFDQPPPPRPSTVQPQGNAIYSMRLKEMRERSGMPAPHYECQSNDREGDDIAWNASVYLNGLRYGNQWAKTKREAQHLASKEALERLSYNTRFPYS